MFDEIVPSDSNLLSYSLEKLPVLLYEDEFMAISMGSIGINYVH